MNLDIDTPKGQISLQQERQLLDSLRAAYPGKCFVETKKDMPAQIDGVIIEKRTLIGVFESKCRNMTSEQMHKFNDQWLVTYEKIVAGAEISKRLRVPFYGFLFLIDEPIGLNVKITDNEGNFIPDIKIERTKTQRTINGGSIIRTNAYISLETATPFEIKESI